MNLREHYGGEAICGLLRLFFYWGMNFMAKPFQTHNQQLKMLRKRNILITNGSKAKAILIRENYYQLINGYKHSKARNGKMITIKMELLLNKYMPYINSIET